MNEKIEKAMMEATDTPKFNNGMYYWPIEYVEKFALLIIRQCADAADMAQPRRLQISWRLRDGIFGFLLY